MDLGYKFPLGWIFPQYLSMIQLDGLWAMDEFGTLAKGRRSAFVQLIFESGTTAIFRGQI
jgi:hypothetical protein